MNTKELNTILTKEFIQDEYLNKKKSFEIIAKELGTYGNKVRRRAMKYGIPVREQKEAQQICLSEGVREHPTQGKKRSEKTKIKISETLGINWDNMSDEDRQKISERCRQQWEKLSDEQKKEFHKRSNIAVRKSAVDGSKMERYLLGHLLKAGYDVEFHSKRTIDNMKMELDLFIRNITTAIEIDGPSHFEPIWGVKAFEKTQKADKLKVGLLLNKGYVIIRLRNISNPSKRFLRHSLNILVQELKKIEKEYPPLHERYIKIGDIS
jgi:very-short-patch-repair endonuclease